MRKFGTRPVLGLCRDYNHVTSIKLNQGQKKVPIGVIHEGNWHCELKIYKRLVNESMNVFAALQKDPKNRERSRLLKASQNYRAVLGACVQEFERSSTEVEAYYATSLETYELIFSLCEILFVEAPHPGTVTPKLVSWLGAHADYCGELLQRVINEQNPTNAPTYWPAIYSCVFHGRTTDAQTLLQLSKGQGSGFTTMEGLLAAMPVYEMGHSPAEFKLRWDAWSQECKQRTSAGEFMSCDGLHTLGKILSGDFGEILDHKQWCGSWFGLLIAKLLFCEPMTQRDDLGLFVQECITLYEEEDGSLPDAREYGVSDPVIKAVISAAFRMDPHGVLKVCSDAFSTWWLPVHMADLWHRVGVIAVDTTRDEGSLRDHLVLEYGCGLAAHQSLWPVGCVYLQTCGESGRWALQQVLPRLPPTNDRRALKVAALYERMGMQSQASSICKVMGLRALKNGKLSAALGWCQQAKDTEFATTIARRFLDQYLASGSFGNLDSIGQLSPALLQSKDLVFLVKYREFHLLYGEERLREASDLLLALISSRSAPVRFWFTLLLDALPLLEAPQLLFSSLQTYDLMHALEDLLLHERFSAPTSQGEKQMEMSDDRKKEHIELFRVALAKNLARAIVQEG